MNILGLSAFYHDSAACLLQDGKIIAAAQEERFTRKKHDASFPKNAVEFCLQKGGIQVSDLDYVGFYDKPFIKFERILETYLGIAPKGIKQYQWFNQIVANKICQIDVDKIDYIRRDCYHLGLTYVNPKEFSRLVTDMRVCIINERPRKLMISWPKKLQYEIFTLFRQDTDCIEKYIHIIQ